VAIFTKFDVLITKVYDRNKDEEENLKFACLTLMEKFEKPLRGYKYPPCAYAQFECMHVFHFRANFWDSYLHPAIYEDEGNHQEQVGELIKKTTASMDNLALKMLFVTVQQNNLEVCIDCAVATYVVC
jgi:hypothetical protein